MRVEGFLFRIGNQNLRISSRRTNISFVANYAILRTLCSSEAHSIGEELNSETLNTLSFRH